MDPTYAARYADLYHRHWWWRAREALLVRMLNRLALPRPARILDVGCGDGFFFPRLERFGAVRGIEVDQTLLPSGSPHRPHIFTQPLGDPTYDGWRFDLIKALDVVEHTIDDGQALAQIASMLEPGGRLLITVPAFMLLWDRHDELNHHYRRYTKRQLGKLLERHGRVKELRYLFPGLFLPKLAVKVVGQVSGVRRSQDGFPPATLNRLLARYFDLEDAVLGPWRLPFGTSVLGVLEVPPSDQDARR